MADRKTKDYAKYVDSLPSGPTKLIDDACVSRLRELAVLRNEAKERSGVQFHWKDVVEGKKRGTHAWAVNVRERLHEIEVDNKEGRSRSPGANRQETKILRDKLLAAHPIRKKDYRPPDRGSELAMTTIVKSNVSQTEIGVGFREPEVAREKGHDQTSSSFGDFPTIGASNPVADILALGSNLISDARNQLKSSLVTNEESNIIDDPSMNELSPIRETSPVSIERMNVKTVSRQIVPPDEGRGKSLKTVQKSGPRIDLFYRERRVGAKQQQSQASLGVPSRHECGHSSLRYSDPLAVKSIRESKTGIDTFLRRSYPPTSSEVENHVQAVQNRKTSGIPQADIDRDLVMDSSFQKSSRSGAFLNWVSTAEKDGESGNTVVYCDHSKPAAAGGSRSHSKEMLPHESARLALSRSHRSPSARARSKRAKPRHTEDHRSQFKEISVDQRAECSTMRRPFATSFKQHRPAPKIATYLKHSMQAGTSSSSSLRRNFDEQNPRMSAHSRAMQRAQETCCSSGGGPDAIYFDGCDATSSKKLNERERKRFSRGKPKKSIQAYSQEHTPVKI